MTIAEYVKSKNIKAHEFAALCGVSPGIARLWICGAVSPRLFHAHVINKLSRGKIKMVEMLSHTDKELYQRAGL